MFFAFLMGTSLELAGVVFFKITATGYRDQIIETLLEKRYGDKWDAFWSGKNGEKGSGISVLIRQLNDKRNQIVHWHTLLNIGADGKAKNFVLRPPNFWDTRPDRPFIDTGQLNEFSDKAQFVAGSVMAFGQFLGNPSGFPQEVADAWPKIFEQPATYPPSDSHPLSPNYKAPGNPPQSSHG
jgi:hypothetical protein